MIKKLLDYLPGNKRKKAVPRQPKLNIIPRSEHHVSRNDISDHALKVLYRLNKAGHEAYLVGGGVRDLLLHKHPKDFDIATSASPEEVHNLFRNSRLIGRRFKLVHVLFGREIIEVATFRGQHKEDDKHSASSEEGMILRDNVYGTKEEDALRRDFTVNALYYCVKDFSIHDYANGLEDLNKKQLRLIGDPDTRYREDPVRMLRAVRFATKLDFDLEPSTAKPITELADLLAHIPSARLFEEVLKLFMSGHALENFLMLRELGLFKHLFPDADACLDQNNERDYRFIEIALKNTDIRIKQDKPVTPAFLYSAFLWLPLQEEWQRSQKAGNSAFPALHLAANKVIDRQTRATSIPKRFGIPMKEIWEMQLRLPKRQGKRAEQIASHPRFRASYDFLLLREQSGENLDGLGQWWTDYQKSDAHSKRKLIKDTVPNGPRKRSRSRSGPRKKPSQKPNQ
ncbi:MAG: polynucleotide adenylyltransferase PcnB [Pseudomonadales bacterium]|nr:polynucleotide adenylyltransferase PcnB [Pseudomonadales bacterium]